MQAMLGRGWLGLGGLLVSRERVCERESERERKRERARERERVCVRERE